jgi:hypothetical protein
MPSCRVSCVHPRSRHAGPHGCPREDRGKTAEQAQAGPVTARATPEITEEAPEPCASWVGSCPSHTRPTAVPQIGVRGGAPRSATVKEAHQSSDRYPQLTRPFDGLTEGAPGRTRTCGLPLKLGGRASVAAFALASSARRHRLSTPSRAGPVQDVGEAGSRPHISTGGSSVLGARGPRVVGRLPATAAAAAWSSATSSPATISGQSPSTHRQDRQLATPPRRTAGDAGADLHHRAGLTLDACARG